MLRFFLVFVPVIPVAMALGQDTAIVATVNGRVITQHEFLSRYALSVFPYKDVARLGPAVKRQFLYSLIAEKLLAAEAVRRGVNREEAFLRSLKTAEEKFVRDKLYHDSVRAVVSVTPEDVRARFQLRQRETEYQFLFSTSEIEIRNLQGLLDAGISFDTLLAAQQAASQAASGWNSISVSSIGLELRQAIQRLRSGEVSPSVRTPDGFFIVRKVDYSSTDSSGTEVLKSETTIRNELRREKEAERARAFVAGIWNGRKAVISPSLFKRIGQRINLFFRAAGNDARTEVLELQSWHYDSLRKEFSEDFGTAFASIGTLDYRVTDFIDALASHGFRIRSADSRRVPALFRSLVYDLLDVFLITREGYRLDLQYTAEVKRDVDMWSANGLAQSFPDDLWEQFIASDDSVWDCFVRNAKSFGSIAEVKIAEVLNADSTVLGDVMFQFRRGADMKQLAMSYSERPGTKENGGEFGFFPVTENGIIGRTAFTMSIADISGLLRTPEGFSFFQLLDKRYPGKGQVRSMDDLRRMVDRTLRQPIAQGKVEALVRTLAARGHIEVNEDVLKGLETASGQMFTIRFLGFGGSIPAAPGVMPLYRAVMEGMESAPRP